MATDTIVDGRQARITWSAQELPYFDMESFNPQEKAQYDLNRQGLTFLWLVEVSAQEEKVLVGSMTGMNMPFTAAGLLLTGEVKMINRFPQGFPGTIEEKERLHDNLLEHPADFMILIRLAHSLRLSAADYQGGARGPRPLPSGARVSHLEMARQV